MSAPGNVKYEVLSYLNNRKDIEIVKLETSEKSRLKAQLDAATSIQSSEAVTTYT
jgi:hypothetical protein